jgi:hypothetical protein
MIPSECPVNSSHCFSFYYPGALNAIFPRSTGIGGQSFQKSQVVIAHDVQAIRIDFWAADEAEINSVDNSSQIPCPIYGGPQKAFQICIAQSKLTVEHTVISLTHNFHIV